MASVEQLRGGRRVAGVIDSGGVYGARAAAGGNYVFMAATAAGPDGTIAPEAVPGPPYHLSESAHVRAQTRYMFERYRDDLETLGSSIDDIVQLEQYVQRKAHADGYAQVARGPGFMDRNRPGSLMIQTGDYLPAGAAVSTTGLAIVPDESAGLVKRLGVRKMREGESHPGQSEQKSANLAFSEIVTAGPYAFSTFFASDYVSGIHPEARVPDWIWWGNEVRAEAELGNRIMGERLETIGSDFSQVVNFTLYLTEMSDLYEFDLTWREAVGDDPPSRTVIPVRGMGSPRKEGLITQEYGSCKMESQYRYLRPEFGVVRETISTGAPTLGLEAEATRAGDLLWISGILAGGPDGPIADLSPAGQLDHILGRMEAVCEAGGSSLADLLRVRAYVLTEEEGWAVYAALKRAIPQDPPCVAVSVVPGPLQVPGASILLDGVAWVRGA